MRKLGLFVSHLIFCSGDFELRISAIFFPFILHPLLLVFTSILKKALTGAVEMTQYTKCLLGRGCELPCQKPCNAGPGSAHLYSSVPKGIRETGLTNPIKHMSQIVWIMEAESKKKKRKKEIKNRKGERKIDRRDLGKEPKRSYLTQDEDQYLRLSSDYKFLLCHFYAPDTHTYIHTSDITHAHVYITHMQHIHFTCLSHTYTHTH